MRARLRLTVVGMTTLLLCRHGLFSSSCHVHMRIARAKTLKGCKRPQEIRVFRVHSRPRPVLICAHLRRSAAKRSPGLSLTTTLYIPLGDFLPHAQIALEYRRHLYTCRCVRLFCTKKLYTNRLRTNAAYANQASAVCA